MNIILIRTLTRRRNHLEYVVRKKIWTSRCRCRKIQLRWCCCMVEWTKRRKRERRCEDRWWCGVFCRTQVSRRRIPWPRSFQFTNYSTRLNMHFLKRKQERMLYRVGITQLQKPPPRRGWFLSTRSDPEAKTLYIRTNLPEADPSTSHSIWQKMLNQKDQHSTFQEK